MKPSKKFPGSRLALPALLALFLFSSAVTRADEQRWLFIFDTSATMKKRLPLVESEIKTLLTIDFAGSLHPGDSVGVWTFDDKLRMGKFPLVTWDPGRTMQVASNLMTFVRKQSYSGTSSFGTLQPTLEGIIEDSERLTVVIVCAGSDEIHWTPYNDGMNETMKQTRDDRKKINEPFVIVLRTQLGKYIGATVNFPPIPSNLPAFPLLPREIRALPQPPPPPVVVVRPPPPAPPLVIVGTHVSSDTNDISKFAGITGVPAAAAEKPAAAIVTAPAAVTIRITNAAPSTATAAIATNAAIPVTLTTNASATNAPVDDRDTRILTYVGVGLFAAAIVLVIFLITRRSGPDSSLITTSMQGERRPPEQK